METTQRIQKYPLGTFQSVGRISCFKCNDLTSERLHQLAGKLESEALRAARGKASVKTIVGKTIVNVILQGSCEDSGTVQVFHKIRLKDISRDRIHGLRQQTTGISPSAFKGSLITQHENHAGSRFNRFVPNGFDTKTFRILF